MTDKEILEAIKAGKKLNKGELDYLVYSDRVVKEEPSYPKGSNIGMRSIIKLCSEYYEIDWEKDEIWGQDEFPIQPYLVKPVKKVIIDYEAV